LGLDILDREKLTLLINAEQMTNRKKLIQELKQAPNELVQTVLDFLHRVKTIHKNHPLEKFVGIIK
jgi:hypothetical protein